MTHKTPVAVSSGDLERTDLTFRVADRIRPWRVDVERTTETEASILIFGHRDRRPVVLKIVKELGDEWRSGPVLHAFDRRGMVRVYDYIEGAMLLERAVPGHSLVSLVDQDRDTDATGILANVIAAMSPGRVPTGTPSVQDWGRAFERYAASGDVQIPRQLVTEARDRSEGSHWGTRVRGGRGAAESLGVTRACTRPATIRARVERFARELPVDPNRVLGWAYSQAVLAAIWTIEDALDPGTRAGPLALATAIQPMLSRARRQTSGGWQLVAGSWKPEASLLRSC